jgi:IS4 transposase
MRQAWAHLGRRIQSMRVRVVWIQTRDNSPLIVVTNLGPEQLSAELVSELYRSRWKIEMFFRWIKCILRCGHWLAESPSGVAIQMYLALIAALLLQLYTGRKPNRRMMELLQWHQLGYANEAELRSGLEREQQRISKLKA